MQAAAREFSLKDERVFNRAGPVRWIASHALRYPIWPAAMLLAAVANNTAFSYVQVFVGRAFDVIATPGFTRAALSGAAEGQFVEAGMQGVNGRPLTFSGA